MRKTLLDLNKIKSFSQIIPVTLLSFILVSNFSAYLRTGFFADDFLQLGTFYHNAKPYGHTSVTLGRYWANIYWGISTTAFGTTADTPYLIFTTVIFLSALYFLYLAIKPILRLSHYLWILVILFATGCTLPLLLWASNNVHTMAILIISIGIFTFSKQFIHPDGAGIFSKYSIWESLTYCLLLFANPLYSPFLLIGIVSFALKFKQILRMKGGFTLKVWIFYFFIVQTILPVTVLMTISLPQTLNNHYYQHSGLSYISKNFEFYKNQIAPGHTVLYAYCLLFFLGIITFISSVVRRHWFAMLFLYLGFSVLIPIFVQQNQHYLNYLVVPILTITMGTLIEVNSVRGSKPHPMDIYLSTIVFIGFFIILFTGSTSVREYYIDYNPGYGLSSLRSQIASLVPANANLCLEENLNSAQKNWLEGGLDGQWGMLHSPVNAASVIFAPRKGCTAGHETQIIEIYPNTRGWFNAQLK